MSTVDRFVKLFAASVAIGLVVAVTVALLAPQASAIFSAGEGVPESIDLDELAVRSVMYDRHGNELAVLHGEQNRVEVPLSRIPDDVITAVLAVEDEAFYQHKGISLRSIIRAFFADVQSGEIRQGGSTITQQVIKNSLLTPERDLERKIQEIVLARRLEKQMTKDEILERYLNTVYLGNGAYGFEAASELYFGFGVDQLSMGQGALLASMIRNPSNTDPFRYPEATRRNWRLALDRLVDLGHMTQEDADAAYAAPLPTVPLLDLPKPDDYFIEEVKQVLLDDPDFGYSAVFQGGLEIHTTFDPEAQRLAEEARNQVLPETDGVFTAALASLEPHTGAVRAMVGGPGFDDYKYNLATQGLRQPGSSFKTFVLTAAIENGAVPNDTINGTGPCDLARWTEPDWKPINFGNSRGAVTTLRNATLRSYNCSFARLGIWTGIDKVVDTARRMGITSPLDEVPAISLGTEEVSPLEMASAYGVLANDGIRHEPYYIERIEDRDGNVLYQHELEPERVLDEQVARLVTEVLEANIRSGTGTRARLSGRPAAGKTGTAQNFEDAWFVGYVPQLSTAVWMGAPAEKIPMRGLGGVNVTGGSYPAMLWGQYMNAVLDGQEVIAFIDPERTRRGKYQRLPGERYVSTRPATTAPLPKPQESTTAPSGTDPPPPVPSTEETPTTTAPKPGNGPPDQSEDD